MSSDLQSTLEFLQMSDYVSVAIVTAVLYDYVLTFSREVHYVWHRPWTSVSTLFVLVRCLGLFSNIILALLNSTLVPDSVKMYVSKFLLSVASIDNNSIGVPQLPILWLLVHF
ncbi:hypothetical protein HD554DRAFT_240241 [Boletus coccyginus]|nr:hypothetical protein HD554DRAFT_240241 [Boletus coccyginus]